MASVLSSSRTGNSNFDMFVLGSGGLGAATLTLSAMTGDESCSEVSSSNSLTGANSAGGAVSPPSLLSVGMSPHTSLATNEITDVDLDFWDLDLNSHSPPHGLGSIAAASNTVANIHRSLAQLTETKFDPSSLNLQMQNSPPDIKFDPSTLGDFGRDDISPSGSNGFMDNYSIDLKKKKGPVPRQAEELCLVCGDRASGYHYNALTCEGCKGFFRRSITKNAVYRCKYGDNCEMDMYMRRKCQECRLKKCLNVGMRPECVVPEYQCQVKREQKKAREKDKKPDICDLGSPIVEETKSMLSPQSSYEDSLGGFPKPKLAPLPVNLNPAPKNGVKPLSREQEELIQTLVYYQEEYEQPSEEDLKKITFSFDTEDTSDMRFKHITEMTILTVQLIVEFSKRLPGFDTLQREDQITLLKACSSEVMMLRAARRYDANTDSIVFGNSYPYTQDSYDMAGLGDSADVLFRFCRNLCKMKVDNAEYALLAAIAIFSERPQLVELRKVEKLQEIYLDALKAYVENRRTPQSTLVFAKLLNVLTELRTLGNINAEVCFSLTVKNKKLPPFLAEIWDVHQC